MHGSKAPSVRGCPNYGMLIHHYEGCKHMICYGCGHTRMRHQSIAAADDIEVTFRSRKDVKKDWKKAKARALLWRRKVLVRGTTRLWKDQMLLCGEEDRSAIDGALLIATRTRQGWCQVMACDGDLMAACRSGLRMSVWSRRHCLW